MQEQDTQWIRHPDAKGGDEIMRRVQQWFEQDRTVMWFPIWSRENFPTLPAELLCLQEQSLERQVLFIKEVDDLLTIPAGITGWLLLEGEKDTDIVVGVWDQTAHFLTMAHKQTGENETLQTRIAWALSVQTTTIYPQKSDV